MEVKETGEGAEIPAQGSRAKSVRSKAQARLISEMYNTCLLQASAEKGSFL